MDQAGLSAIEYQIQSEVGDGWESNAMVLRGRDAVREEHGLPKLVEPDQQPSGSPDRRPIWKRLLGR